MECPKCGFSQSDTHSECARCGVIFSKIGITHKQATHATSERGPRKPDRPTGLRPQASGSRKKVVPAATSGTSPRKTKPTGPQKSIVLGTAAGIAGSRDDSVAASSPDELLLVEGSEVGGYLDDEQDLIPEPRHMDRDDWIVLGSGFVITLVVMFFPLLNHIFLTLVTLIHEMGHTIVGWLFAYPSVPAFDLRYGGGVTLHVQRSTFLLIMIYAGMAFLIYTYRKNLSTLVFLTILLVIHMIFAFTYFHEVAILFMGHGTELIIATIFFYRALSGAAVVHSVERPLYCAIGLFIVFSDIRFSFRLMTSHHARYEYEQAKGGGHWMDFSRIAEDFLGVDLTSVAFFFFLCCLLPLVLGFLTFRYQEYIRRTILRLWAREPLSSS
jgi:hypothetical protein